jgi:hypothetical protein
MIDFNSDLLLSILGCAVAMWSMGVVLLASRSDASERELALESIAAALTMLLLEQGKRIRERQAAGDKGRSA